MREIACRQIMKGIVQLFQIIYKIKMKILLINLDRNKIKSSMK